MRVGGSGHAAVRSVRRCANAMQHTHVAVRACNTSLLQRARSTACPSFRARQVAAAANNIGNVCKRHGRAATALRCACVPMAFYALRCRAHFGRASRIASQCSA